MAVRRRKAKASENEKVRPHGVRSSDPKTIRDFVYKVADAVRSGGVSVVLERVDRDLATPTH